MPGNKEGPAFYDPTACSMSKPNMAQRMKDKVKSMIPKIPKPS
jgi:hypothetical protein